MGQGEVGWCTERVQTACIALSGLSGRKALVRYVVGMTRVLRMAEITFGGSLSPIAQAEMLACLRPVKAENDLGKLLLLLLLLSSYTHQHRCTGLQWWEGS